MKTLKRHKELTAEVSRVINAFLAYKNGDTGFYKECIRQWALSDLEKLKTGLLSFELEDMRHELYILDTEPLKRFCRDIEQRYLPVCDEEIFSESNKELYNLLVDTHGKGTAVMMMHKLNEIAHLNNIIVGDVCSIIDELQPQRQAPQEPSTERAKKAFKKALEAGYMKETVTGYKWVYNNGSKASLSYFVVQVYNPDGAAQTPFKALGALFGVKALDRASDKAFTVKKPQKWREAIDELLKDL